MTSPSPEERATLRSSASFVLRIADSPEERWKWNDETRVLANGVLNLLDALAEAEAETEAHRRGECGNAELREQLQQEREQWDAFVDHHEVETKGLQERVRQLEDEAQQYDARWMRTMEVEVGLRETSEERVRQLEAERATLAREVDRVRDMLDEARGGATIIECVGCALLAIENEVGGWTAYPEHGEWRCPQCEGELASLRVAVGHSVNVAE